MVAKSVNLEKIQILGEMKGWAYSGVSGFQLDTIRVNQKAPRGLGHLVWASTMAWALETTPCTKSRLLAINDDELKHASLVRYFQKRGFSFARDVGSSPCDLPLRMIWGGAGTLMNADCVEVFEISYRLWRNACKMG